MKFGFISLILSQSLFLLASANYVDPPAPGIEFPSPGSLSQPEPMNLQFTELYNQIVKSTASETSKRDVTSDLLNSVLQSLNNSNVVIDVLHQIADSPTEMNTLSNYIFQVLVSVLTGKAIKGLNVTVNATQIISAVNSSGIIESTLESLLFNDQQLEKFAANLGSTLVNNTWIPKVLYTFGNTGHLSFQTIFELARNTQSKDPGFTGETYQPLHLLRRDDSNYLGSLQTFINNLIGSGLTSSIFLDSLENILVAVKNSGVVISLTQTAVADPKIQYMGGFIANKLYNYGVFDQIPLDKYIQQGRHNGLLKNLVQFAMTDPKWLIPVAKIFLQWYDLGVNDQIQRNMYGP